ncbi:FAD binding domain-containing protein [uncultured Williamsia sp.]|uniref:FAD binding domain-containing protein n=1 Tax=uncultured Williamsia sp. TaxID=259311 RepID=UPI0026363FE0|nr:FAD binding domain-containing protein [uncultured Williamsia sp.]
MDLHFVDDVVRPTSREDLPQALPGDTPLAGGTSVMAEPGRDVRRLVDLTALGWPDLTVTGDGLEIAATCTIDRLVHADLPESWTARTLFRWCADSLLASYKIWHTATVGGNVCLALPAGSMTSLCSVLDASLLIWHPDGTDSVVSVEELVVGDQRTSLAPGDLLRSIHLSTAVLTARVAARRVSYAEYGRAGAVVLGRATDDGMVISVSGGSVRPFAVPVTTADPDEVVSACAAAVPDSAWFTDAHGTADWRRSVVPHLIREVADELGSDT